MKIALVTDAWLPQVNGVVTTLVELQHHLEAAGHQLLVVHPGLFRTRPCPGYPGIDLAVRPGPALDAALERFAPDAIHLATEGPLGWAGRRHCLRPGLEGLSRPISLFVGRVSYEKNIQAFLQTPLAGSKVVCGVGPVERALRAAHPQVHWIGILPRRQLAGLYAAADVFVFPSHADTFGLVMVEAMACGTPVAAFPVDGPLEVLGQPHPDGGRSLGGVMDWNLQRAVERALEVPRAEARRRAEDFGWAHAAAVFAGHLVPAHGAGTRATGTLTNVT